MKESRSGPKDKSSVEKRNTVVTAIAFLTWLGLSILGEALFIGQNERLDAGAILVSGGGPILLISAVHLLSQGILGRGLVIRSILGFVCIGAGVGELTDLDKGLIWGPVGLAALSVFVTTLLWRVFRRSEKPA